MNVIQLCIVTSASLSIGTYLWFPVKINSAALPSKNCNFGTWSKSVLLVAVELWAKNLGHAREKLQLDLFRGLPWLHLEPQLCLLLQVKPGADLSRYWRIFTRLHFAFSCHYWQRKFVKAITTKELTLNSDYLFIFLEGKYKEDHNKWLKRIVNKNGKVNKLTGASLAHTAGILSEHPSGKSGMKHVKYAYKYGKQSHESG